ncbi:sulfatase-like hydrolase/transferase [Halobacterium jilantaiense]|uniref:Arylsulfatase A n=1 Tax=Halobacterium jilantaiense TaxID=355548 RepID=A0A1I0MSI0_9EURY|nr:sulfatase-like hydrolase/transferase [Halobacterium jilantaiense]SEV91671.1 Arylsulfatase A [Halobacterium jilantaiense]
MQSSSKIRKALYYLSQGEYGKVTDYISNYRRNASLPPSINARYSYSPSGLTQAPEIEYITLNDDDRVHYPSVSGDEFEVESKSDFESLEFKIIGTDNVKSLTITCKYDSGEKVCTIDTGVKQEPTVPVSIQLEDPTTRAKVEVDYNTNPLSDTLKRISPNEHCPRLTKPAIPNANATPVFLISIDSLRHDARENLPNLIDELGGSAYFPEEPRTQGCWTPPSHASMFTGTYPGVHSNIGSTGSQIAKIDPSLPTIGKIMSEQGYKSSAITTSRYLRPELGFGDGFDRFECTANETHYLSADNGLRDATSTVNRWVNEDAAKGFTNLFYFWHIFPPHWPYVPPAENRPENIDLSSSFRDTTGDYLDWIHREPRDHDAEYQRVLEMYDACVEFVDAQVSTFLRTLKNRGLFEDALVIILGDHGEEFGERGFYGHNSLNDDNIRPFMAVKPPETESWPVRDDVDFIDILPTIAKFVGSDVPDECEGLPIQRGESNRPRIAERIGSDYYNVSVEIGGWKGIFTCEENHPDRPDPEALENLVCEEYYEIQSVRSGTYINQVDSIGDERRTELLATAREFLSTGTANEGSHLTRMSDETRSQLQDLGYIE